MTKRFLDCRASDFATMTKNELLQSILASEGRTIVSETIGMIPSQLVSVTNAEFAASQGADILLLNMFDVNKPVIYGLPEGTPAEDAIKEIKRLTGRIVGINLEPVDEQFDNKKTSDIWDMTSGRLATIANAIKAYELGASFVVLTGNPGNGISNPAICNSLRKINQAIGDKLILIAGKMHAAGVLGEGASKIISTADIKQFVAAGANIILLPAPGTVPGISPEFVREMVEYAHSLGVMTMTAVGTSQEGADEATIRQIALMAKMTGTDLHHIGDTGYIGIALPENIRAYSIAIRGIRHWSIV